MYSTDIIDFWKANPAYWLPLTPEKQKEADETIRALFWDSEWYKETPIGQVIYLDQFSRHFARLGLYTEEDVAHSRKMAVDTVMSQYDTLVNFDEIELLFALMPFKHLKQYEFIFNYLHTIWLPHKHQPLTDFPDLMRFYIDTYKKAFTLETVKTVIETEHFIEPYDPALICDSYPHIYRDPEWSAKGYYDSALLKSLKPYNKGYVSLSGGVDSMVMLAYLKHLGADVGAIHIMYGNRAESEHEYRFLTEYCYKLRVPLYTYRIPWLRRADVDRQFYEDMTRQLRFWVYTAVANTTASPTPIFMGHIQDDIVENIWTNIASCTHMNNLKKMQPEETQMGTHIVRPFLTIEKRSIYATSNLLGIPYLKNTTPSWSNRGKFREHFHAATVKQFGPSIDHKVIAFAEAIEKQAKLVRMFLYEPMYASFKDKTMDITPAIKADLDAPAWAGIFEHVCHTFLNSTRPGLPAIKDFCRRLQNKRQSFRMHLKKDLTIDFQHSSVTDSYTIRFL
jgi:tRNA(Ile)-lysidine synthetase-like protein